MLNVKNTDFLTVLIDSNLGFDVQLNEHAEELAVIYF
jgi:hypothetical protein